jgi:low temperature requirement protein LtrA
MPGAERERNHGYEHQVTPLELFFDHVFVFATTRVTKLFTNDPSWGGLLRGMLALGAMWWAMLSRSSRPMRSSSLCIRPMSRTGGSDG